MNDMQKRRAMIIALKGPAREFFKKNARHLRTYDEAVSLLRSRYNRLEKQHRFLNEWQRMRLTVAMRDKP